MHPWIYTVDRHRYPRWEAILAGLETAICTGLLRHGERLPGQRLIADLMGVHVNTLNRAMQEAARRGLIHARVGSGTTVIARRNPSDNTLPPS
ncbi:winged helix-turn-helix domain-containing protein [Burkholderia thailandensis]|uniref:GntR family transcriptional regulator n=1 Tax=Burkholderia thailandensis TaxID=57975 RepID=UPI000371507F|nr:winged helix-turn-helix domain-containing protein [Burkholderia thailandensis]MCS3392747.1 winged helix-turn-helix domain-containing protein [Burkholderia thailandensis]MCS6425975.1 winged helix-turn-helix domain-containing protein [Burkholderia thailandensis]MCS6454034.1 winged helix-turn-helix domain-containing protein [Burkholderia thailandensis]MCS6465218.1 winged helix-turn-helix domain-containing protein [Burkholderia thailandensis]MCS6483116.1 winged helix-turn-helix domain-containin